MSASVETCAPAVPGGPSSCHGQEALEKITDEEGMELSSRRQEREGNQVDTSGKQRSTGDEPEQEQEPPEQQQHPRQQPSQEDEQNREEQEQLQVPEKSSLVKDLWSLIPGTIQRRSSQASTGSTLTSGESSPVLGSELSYELGFTAAMCKSPQYLTIDAAGRWFPPDIHPPLSDRARRHRARALARLRARRRALAAAGLSSDRKLSSLRRNASDTSTDAESFDGGGENNLCSPRGSNLGKGKEEVEGGDPKAGDCSAAGSGLLSMSPDRVDNQNSESAEGVVKEGDGDGTKVNPTSINASSRVGDLFELMRNVSANAAAAARAAEGGGRSDTELAEGRELGRPVKYKYRQEAARSRKRTRGRFVSEKAPAFVSITELMALRRAERERQEQKDAAPVFVGAG